MDITALYQIFLGCTGVTTDKIGRASCRERV